MKKKLVLTILIFSQILGCAFAKNESVYNLNTNNAYILALNHRPFDLSVSNQDILKVGVVTDLFSVKSQLVVETLKEGICYITYKSEEKDYVIKILVDDKSNVELIEIDKP